MKRALNWAAFLLFLTALYVFAGPAALGGPASYVMVVGGSMEPTYTDGDLVVAIENDSYDVGDIVVYDAPAQGQFNVIHRIIEDTPGGFITQGDNRDEADGWDVSPDAIYGSASVHVPHGGSIIKTLRRPAVIFGLVAGLGALAFFKRSDTKKVRGRRRAGSRSHDNSETSTTTGET